MDARLPGARGSRTLVTKHRLIPLFLLFLLAACSGDAPGEPGPGAVRDAADVRLITVIPNGDSVSWHLGPRLAEFGPEAGVDLYRVVGASRLGDGRVVVGNGGASQILVFDGGGRLLGRLGGEGDGPGEYRSLAWVMATGGDTLLTYDSRLRRISILTGAGEIVGSSSPEPTGDAFFPEFLGTFADGALLAVVGQPFPDATAPEFRYRDSLTVLRYDRDGHLLDELGRFPNQEAFVVRSETGDLAWSEIPFGRRTALAVDAAAFHLITGDAYEIRTYDTAGDLRRIVRVARSLSEVTPADRRAFRTLHRERLSGIEDPARRQLHEKLLQQLPFPKYHAGYTDILVSRRSELWARRDESDWDVFAANGRLIGEARLPARFVVYEIGEDYVLGLQRDELGIEHVTLHRLVRSPGSTSDSVTD